MQIIHSNWIVQLFSPNHLSDQFRQTLSQPNIPTIWYTDILTLLVAHGYTRTHMHTQTQGEMDTQLHNSFINEYGDAYMRYTLAGLFDTCSQLQARCNDWSLY